jgi:hypothetical protein
METAVIPIRSRTVPRMSENFQFHLPDWSPQRLIREALVSHGFRHLSEEPIDPETAPWPVLRGILFAFLRHQQSNFDECLRWRARPDEAFRDELASRVHRAACAKYSWIRGDDPRPFPEEPDTTTRPLDKVSRQLADLHSVRDHLCSAIRDLRREGHREDQEILERQLLDVQADIDRLVRFFQVPKIIERESGNMASCMLVYAHAPEQQGEYFFATSSRFSANHLKPLGFRCSACCAHVMRLKQTQDFGQGYRMVVFSCHCLSLAVVCPPAGPGCPCPMTLGKWRDYCTKTEQGAASK